MSEQYDGERAACRRSIPATPRRRRRARYEIAWPEASVLVGGATCASAATRTAYHVEVELDVDDGDEPFARRRWKRDIPRNLQ